MVISFHIGGRDTETALKEFQEQLCQQFTRMAEGAETQRARAKNQRMDNYWRGEYWRGEATMARSCRAFCESIKFIID